MHDTNEKKLVKKWYQLVDSWYRIAPESAFGGMSLAGFTAAAQTSLDERQNASDAGVGNGKGIARRETSG